MGLAQVLNIMFNVVYFGICFYVNIFLNTVIIVIMLLNEICHSIGVLWLLRSCCDKL